MQRRPKRGPVLLGRRSISIDDLVDVALLGRPAELHGAARETMAALRGVALPALAGLPPVRVDGPEPWRRAAALAYAQALAMAVTGAEPEAVDALCDALNAGRPVGRQEVPPAVALAAGGALAVAAAEEALGLVEEAAAVTAAALGADLGFADPVVARLLPHAGVRETLDHLRPLLPEVGGDADVPALRRLPQVHGAARTALRGARDAVELALLGAPVGALVVPGEERTLATGNDAPAALEIALGGALLGLRAASGLVQERLRALGAADEPLAPPDGEDAARALDAAATALRSLADAERLAAERSEA